jgi:hypothetical protein
MNQYIAISQCLISVGLLTYLWIGPVARMRRDNFRSRIRSIRDGLFDFMWKHSYDFDSPGYRSTRQMLNGMIRCSNYFSITIFIHAACFAARRQDAAIGENEIEELPDGALKQELCRVRTDAGKAMVRFIFIERPSGFVAIVMFAVLACFIKIGKILTSQPSVEKGTLVERSTSYMMRDASRIGSLARKNELAMS